MGNIRQGDDATWARGRGWTLWKGLLILAQDRQLNPTKADEARRVIAEIIAEG